MQNWLAEFGLVPIHSAGGPARWMTSTDASAQPDKDQPSMPMVRIGGGGDGVWGASDQKPYHTPVRPVAVCRLHKF